MYFPLFDLSAQAFSNLSETIVLYQKPTLGHLLFSFQVLISLFTEYSNSDLFNGWRGINEAGNGGRLAHIVI